MSVECQIRIYKAKEDVYYAGDTIKGIVKYIIHKPTEYQAVTLSLLGIGKCKWTESDSDGGSNYYHGSEKYITVNINLLHSQHPVTLQTGSYEHHFQFELPENIPPSFKNKHCTIRYRIQIKFEKNNLFSINKKFHAEIPVYGFVEPIVEGPVVFGLDKKLLKLFSIKNHVLKLQGELAKTCLSPGENAQLASQVKNDTDEEPTVSAHLHCYTILTDDNKRTNKTRDKIKDCFAKSNVIRKRSVVNISMTIPTRGELYTINCKVLKKVYVLRVEVQLPAPHRNPVVEVPIVIGERKGFDRITIVRDEPFWELMLEDDEKKGDE